MVKLPLLLLTQYFLPPPVQKGQGRELLVESQESSCGYRTGHVTGALA